MGHVSVLKCIEQVMFNKPLNVVYYVCIYMFPLCHWVLEHVDPTYVMIPIIVNYCCVRLCTVVYGCVRLCTVVYCCVLLCTVCACAYVDNVQCKLDVRMLGSVCLGVFKMSIFFFCSSPSATAPPLHCH